MAALRRSQVAGSVRSYPPSMLEVKAIREGNHMCLPLEFIDGELHGCQFIDGELHGCQFIDGELHGCQTSLGVYVQTNKTRRSAADFLGSHYWQILFWWDAFSACSSCVLPEGPIFIS